MNHQKMISKCLFAAIALWSVQWTIVSASASPPPAQSANEIPASPTRLNENAAVKQLLQQFEITFNARNLDAFLKLYVKATEPTYIFGHELITGRPALEVDYRQRFFGSEDQQLLRLKLISLRHLGDGYLVAVSTASVTDAAGKSVFQGISTLILQRENGEWRVLHDHTS
jgi:ketosteroid isomerase-like protein